MEAIPRRPPAGPEGGAAPTRSPGTQRKRH